MPISKTDKQTVIKFECGDIAVAPRRLEDGELAVDFIQWDSNMPIGNKIKTPTDELPMADVRMIFSNRKSLLVLIDTLNQIERIMVSEERQNVFDDLPESEKERIRQYMHVIKQNHGCRHG